MALINCDECGHEISEKALTCPKCGCPIDDIEEEDEKQKRSSFYKGGLIILFTLIAFTLIGYNNLSNYNKQSTLNDFRLLTNQPIILHDEEIQIQEDQYQPIPIDLDKTTEITIEYVIKSGPNIDVYFMESSEYEKYKSQSLFEESEEFSYDSELSTFALETSERTATIGEGTYYILLDNTDFGATYPPMNFENDLTTISFKVKSK